MRRKKTEIIEYILGFILAVALFAMAITAYYPFYQSDKNLRKLKENVIHENVEKNSKSKKKKSSIPKLDVDWEKLEKTNPDVIGWIKVPGTKIDYPILKNNRWNEYLHKDYKGEYSYVGSIFIQPTNTADFTDQHTVIYGHNMRNKSMFGSLHKFEYPDFYKKHRDIYIYQKSQSIRAEIYSTYDCTDTEETYLTKFDEEELWSDWISMTYENSYYNTDAKPSIDDRIITLSTCSNGHRGQMSRYVVHAIVKDVISTEGDEKDD